MGNRFVHVDRVFRVRSVVAFDEEHYPGMTAEEAEEYERKLPLEEKLELFDACEPELISERISITNEPV